MLRNFLHVAGGDVASKALLLAANLLLIRVLPVTEYAQFSLLLTAVLLGYQLACAPLERLLIAEHAQVAPLALPLLGLFGAVALLAMALWLGRGSSGTGHALALAGIALLSLYQLGRIALQQRQEFLRFAASEVARNGLWLAALLGAVALGLATAPLAIGLLLAATALAGLLAGTWTALRSLPPRAQAAHGVAESVWRARHVVGYSLLGSVLAFLPMLLASHGDDALRDATYGAALRYQAVLGMAVYAFNTILLPAMAQQPREAQRRQARLGAALRLLALALAAYAVAGAAVVAVMPLVDQGRYPALPLVFALIGLAPVLSFAATPAVNALLLAGRAKWILGWMLGGLGAALAAYFATRAAAAMLAPALATVAAYLVVNGGLIGSAAGLSRRSLEA
jgi:O-antigen/teichoic acid export membrane protein